MRHLVVHPAAAPLLGSVPVPSDKSVGHRALLFSAICHGKSRIVGFSRGEDNLATLQALRALGVRIDEVSQAELVVEGVGIFGLCAPTAPLDCGNSGTTMRLMAGLLAAQPFTSTLIGDASLSSRPMMRVAAPLRARGAAISGAPHRSKADEITAPLTIGLLPEGEYLREIEYDSPVASAQVKSALLLSGLYAHGVTTVNEPSVSRDHTERMMRALGVPLTTFGSIVTLDPAGWNGQMAAFDIALPGDISAAAFLSVAAAIVPGSRVTVRSVGVNPTRTGLLEIARDMGVGLSIEAREDAGGEPTADLVTWATALRAAAIGGETVTRAIDEVPIVCALAARASGVTKISGAGELRVKESDRIASMIKVLRAFGVKCEEHADGLSIEGGDGPLKAAVIDSQGDHRIAMTAAVMALVGDGPTRIVNAECIATSFPKFVGTLRALGAKIDVE